MRPYETTRLRRPPALWDLRMAQRHMASPFRGISVWREVRRWLPRF